MRLIRNRVFGYLAIFIFLLFCSETNGNKDKSHARAVFFQPSKVTIKYTKEEVDDELKMISELNVSCLIVQWIATGSMAYYPSAIMPHGNANLVPNIVQASEKHDMDLILGLKMTDDWYSASKTDYYLSAVKNQALISAREIISLYGEEPRIIGWYLPYEVTPGQLKQSSMRHFFSNLSGQIKSLLPNHLVAASFYLPANSKWSEDVAIMWNAFLKESPLDLVILQDGVGTGARDPASAKEYLSSLRELAASTGHKTWIVIEVFDMAYSPASPERVREQIKTEVQCADGFAIFDFSHYLNPARGKNAAALLEELQRLKAWF